MHANPNPLESFALWGTDTPWVKTKTATCGITQRTLRVFTILLSRFSMTLHLFPKWIHLSGMSLTPLFLCPWGSSISPGASSSKKSPLFTNTFHLLTRTSVQQFYQHSLYIAACNYLFTAIRFFIETNSPLPLFCAWRTHPLYALRTTFHESRFTHHVLRFTHYSLLLIFTK